MKSSTTGPWIWYLVPTHLDTHSDMDRFNTWIPGQNGQRFADDIFKCSLLNEICCIFIHISLTHWGRGTHICISKLTIIDSDNGLLHGWCQAIIWTFAVILLIQTLGTNFCEIINEIHTFSFKKMYLKMSVKRQQFHLGLYGFVSRGSTGLLTLCHRGNRPLSKPMLIL